MSTDAPTSIRVIFRADKYPRHHIEPIITAVFDDTQQWPMLTVYEHVGQHGTADPSWMARATRAAYPSEYAPLLAELRSRGYDVTVGKRLVRFYR